MDHSENEVPDSDSDSDSDQEQNNEMENLEQRDNIFEEQIRNLIYQVQSGFNLPNISMNIGQGNMLNLTRMNFFETEEEITNREICNAHMMDYIKNIRNGLSDIHQEYKEEFGYSSITIQLVKIVSEYWKKKKELPNKPEQFDDLVEYCYDYQLLHRPCECLIDNSSEDRKKIIYEIIRKHILFFGDFPSCGILSNMLRFHVIEKRLPSMNEFDEFLKHQREFHEDSEKYYHDHKHQLPTSNLSLLKPVIYDEEKTITCGLCYNEIVKGTKIMKLPCRGKHVFHFDEKECLEGLTITNWLNKNKICPMCKDEIIIQNN